jgi:hypothetical protein
MHDNMRIMFPAPRLAADDDEAEMRALFGITEDSEVTDTDAGNTEPSATETDTTNTTAQEDNTSEDNTDKAEPPKPATETKAPDTTSEKSAKEESLNPEERFMNKQASAFAQMRIQNKELSDLIMSLAKATGQDPKNMADAQAMLKEGLTKVVSKNRNIPEEVLREMEEDKRALAEYKQNQAKQKALEGFKQVQAMYTLSQTDVNNFADKLIEKNINPFTQEGIDLVKEYRNIYFDELIAKAKDEGVQEERARSLKAQNNSTTPSTQQGVSENAGNQIKPVKTVRDLNALFDSLTN